MTSGRGLPSFDLVVPSRTQLELLALDLLTDRTVARPKPPGAADHPIRSAASEPPPVPGRPAFLILLLGIPALLFALVTWQVVEDGPLLRVDERVSRALIHPDRVSAALSDLGNIEVAVPVLVVALLWSARQARRSGTDRWWLPSAAAAVLMALVPVLVVPLKELTDRPGTAVSPGTGYYPSGHTATAAVAYGAATLLVLPWLRSARTRRALVLGYGLVVLGVSFGLVRRGWHWPLDVVGSWCLCTVLLVGFRLLLARHSRR